MHVNPLYIKHFERFCTNLRRGRNRSGSVQTHPFPHGDATVEMATDSYITSIYISDYIFKDHDCDSRIKFRFTTIRSPSLTTYASQSISLIQNFSHDASFENQTIIFMHCKFNDDWNPPDNDISELTLLVVFIYQMRTWQARHEWPSVENYIHTCAAAVAYEIGYLVGE